MALLLHSKSQKTLQWFQRKTQDKQINRQRDKQVTARRRILDLYLKSKKNE